VVVVDDHEAVRSVTTMILGADERFDVVGVAANGEQAIEVCRESLPEIVLLDLNMPVLDGIAAMPRIREAVPGVRIVAWSAVVDRKDEALRAGADAWATKGTDWDDIADRMLELLDG
jgi:DNA-binding NarL/FixJ family response regulator